MKIAHFCQFAPNQCGLYGTAKELVLAERLAGIDARMIAFYEKYQGKQKDGSFETEDLAWAYGADVLVRHSAIPTHLQCAGIPIVLAMHGRPESSMRITAEGDNPVIESFYNKTFDKRHKAFLVFWPEYMDIWKVLVPKEKLFYIPACVDLNEFKPENPPFDLGEYKGKTNILICDIWRDDVTPFNVLFAAAEFARTHEGTKIHLCGIQKEYLKSMMPFFAALRKEGTLGYLSGQSKDIKGLYTACDVMVSPHVIATRTIREALASGVKVVAGSGCTHTPYTANPMDVPAFAEAIEQCICHPNGELAPREVARRDFGLLQMGTAAKEVFTKITTRPAATQRKVLIDVGAHLGETVRRFYRQVEDADQYEIYCFEPDYTTFVELDRNVGHIKNVVLINALAGTTQGMADFYVGQHNQNEGGTALPGKTTGGVDYKHATKVESIDLMEWIRSNINEGDYCILKMNIEGGEYDLMEKLLETGLTSHISKTYIQLHAHKFEMGLQRERFQQIENDFWRGARCKVYMQNKGFHDFDD